MRVNKTPRQPKRAGPSGGWGGVTQSGGGGMSLRKHHKSGHATKSPKLRQWLQREAEARDRPRKHTPLVASSVIEAVRNQK